MIDLPTLTLPPVVSAIILGIVEGLTEYLPVSSTGHMILVGRAIHFEGDRAITFEIVIQLGAILAVVLLYRKRFFALLVPEERNSLSGIDGLMRLGLSCAPAAALGLVAGKSIKAHLFNPLSVAVALFLGGIVLVMIEKRTQKSRVTALEEISLRTAFLLGCFQCFALWPGISRSGSMIVGGLLLGMTRVVAAEYSFLVAVPMMVMATGYELIKARQSLSTDDVTLLAIGFGIALVTAAFAVKVFLELLRTISLAPFGYYRIVLAILVCALLGWSQPETGTESSKAESRNLFTEHRTVVEPCATESVAKSLLPNQRRPSARAGSHFCNLPAAKGLREARAIDVIRHI